MSNYVKAKEKFKLGVVDQLKEVLSSGKPVRSVDFKLVEEQKFVKELSLLTAKPIIVVLNSDEEDLPNAAKIEEDFAQKVGLSIDQVLVINAKLEEELAGLGEEDTEAYLSDLGLDSSGLERLIKKAFATLGLITFLTAGEKEVRAWTIKDGWSAPQAAGVIHTDFEKKFIKADVVAFTDFTEKVGWKGSRDTGKVRSEGKEYIIKDGDVVEFKIGA